MCVCQQWIGEEDFGGVLGGSQKAVLQAKQLLKSFCIDQKPLVDTFCPFLT